MRKQGNDTYLLGCACPAVGKEAMYVATQTECGCRFTDYGKLTALERSSQNDVVPQVRGVFHYLKVLCFFFQVHKEL